MEKKLDKKILIGLIGLAVFLIICVLVIANGTAPLAIDQKIQNWAFSLRDYDLFWLTKLTKLSNTKFIVALLILLGILPWTRKKYGVPIAAAEVTGLAAYTILKKVIARPRPDVSLHLISQGGFSFPSGHGATSLIVYGLGICLIRKYVKNEILKNVLTVILSILIILIGFSRIYVGVHWPTDVLASWGLGIFIICMTLMVIENLENIKEK